jgi:hypothetical protein
MNNTNLRPNFDKFKKKIEALGLENVAKTYRIILHRCKSDERCKNINGSPRSIGKCKFGHDGDDAGNKEKLMQICEKLICYHDFMGHFCMNGNKCMFRHKDDDVETSAIKTERRKKAKFEKEERTKEERLKTKKYERSDGVKKKTMIHVIPTSNENIYKIKAMERNSLINMNLDQKDNEEKKELTKEEFKQLMVRMDELIKMQQKYLENQIIPSTLISNIVSEKPLDLSNLASNVIPKKLGNL